MNWFNRQPTGVRVLIALVVVVAGGALLYSAGYDIGFAIGRLSNG